MTIEQTARIQEVKKITDTEQKTLFDLASFEIESVPLSESICDWDWELASSVLLPKFKSREQSSRELLPKFKSREQSISPSPITETSSQRLTNLERLTNFREQPPPDRSKKLLPNREIREQLHTGQTVIGYSIVPVKGKQYYLTHSQSNKYYPTDKGWFDIKRKGEIDYLYTRWRDSQSKQKSRCMGRVDRVE